MIRADVHRVPLRHLPRGEQDRVLDQPHGGRRRKHVRAAREILLDDVVLRRAGEFLARHVLLVGDRDVERQQPGGGGVDRHRGVHRVERNRLEQRAHVAEMRDRHADLADLTACEHVIAVVAGLGRQIEGDRKAGLALGEIPAIERVGVLRVRMARIGAEHPGLVALAPSAVRWLGHAAALPLCNAA